MASDKGQPMLGSAPTAAVHMLLLLLLFICVCVCALTEYVQGLKLLEALDWSVVSPPISSSVVQVVIGSGKPSVTMTMKKRTDTAQNTPRLLPGWYRTCLRPQAVLGVGCHGNCLLSLSLQTCLPSLPSMPQCTPLFWGQNPLRIPLLCGFRRLPEGAEPVKKEGCNVTYRAPCGWSLRNHNDVMKFLLATDSYDVLQVDFFTFNPSVRLDTPPGPAGPRHPELDLSRGAEPTPVELVGGEGGTRPADFRYRKERWPHGCFLSRGAALFNVCCDCTDGCSDAQSCACVNMTTGGRHYQHHRLSQPVPSGLYECGPWCSCDRARCQNRLVQRGIRLRLQVFHTDGRGWGVRCRDDVDCGTFVCIYAGVILQRIQSPLEAPPPKLTRADLPSDDEVEVVTEWLAPPVLEGWSNPPPPASAGTPTSEATPPLHVPVIQRPPDANATTANTSEQDKVSVTSELEQMDWTPEREGERGRERGRVVCFCLCVFVSVFVFHSCEPNLFIQNVFTDSHDPAFPVIAFFTRRSAGSELFWDYSADTLSFASSLQKQEVPCLCRSDGCRGTFTVEDNLCEVCEFKGQGSMEAE
uniref:Histone-lysine N-methyltransferase SETDB2 n=1 Tax=Sphaeramia orbicularis TaxID=375764 RepID=A0A672ZWH8_9TELE